MFSLFFIVASFCFCFNNDNIFLGLNHDMHASTVHTNLHCVYYAVVAGSKLLSPRLHDELDTNIKQILYY